MADGLLSSIAKIVERSESWIRSSSHGSSPASPPWVPTFQDHLQKLRRILPRMQAVLGEAEEREIQDELVKQWLRDIKEVAYEADDVLDDCQYEVRQAEVEALRGKGLQQVSNSNTRSSSSMDASFWGKIACWIEEVTHRLDEIWKESGALHLRGDSRKRRYERTWVRPPSTSVLPLSKVYGREADISNLIKMIFSPGEDNPSVIPVLGMGGVGKTTLVQHVYNDQAICEHFDLRGWVCVSDDFEVDKLSKRIVEAITKEPCNLNELSVLQEKLVKELSGKRYLLVLDDLWNQDPSLWHILKAPLGYGLQGSTVILTTRNDIVAKITQTMPPHRLGCLSFDDCWQIFQQYAFHGQVPHNSQELLEVGKEIVRKCKGLPLASTTLGGLLRYESDVSKWDDILRSEMWDLQENSENNIRPTLMLSYLHLPTHLKRCFAYCSVFPKDYSFTKNKLVRLWMAQGFIQFHHRVRQLEETGIQYFDELLQRSFFQTNHEYSPEHEDRFVMHDLIHDLAVSVSGGESFVVKNGEIWRLSHDDQSLLRHLAFVPYSYDMTTMVQSLCCDGLGGLRSLLLLRRTDIWIKKHVVTEILDAMLQKLESLRALDLSYVHLRYLPCSFGYLKHLRYLDLTGTEIEVLSESVCHLYLLQTLDLSYVRITKLPDSIENLKELRHMNLCHTGIVMLPETVGELINLQLLDLAYTGVSELPQSVGNLKNLTYLDLSGTAITKFPEPICMLCNLQTLNLNNVAMGKLPRSVGDLQNLRYLNLSETRIERLPLSFGKLSQLQMLNLSFSSIEELPICIGTLRQLRHLDLSSTPVRSLPESICNIFNLQSLLLKNSQLERLPHGVMTMINLQHLDFNSQRVHVPWGIRRLTSLRTLPVFNVSRDIWSCSVGDLKELAELRGRLEISGLCFVGDPEDANMANLRMKTQINKLSLAWESRSCPRPHDLWSSIRNVKAGREIWPRRGSASEAEQACVLEQLQPHSGLTELEMRGYGGNAFPRWVGDPSFSKLVQIVLEDCTNCRYLPPLGQLPSLKQLTIVRAPYVGCIGPEFRSCGHDGASSGVAFPSLEVMTVQDMVRWRSWTGVERGDFPRLAQLELKSCRSLLGDLPNSSCRLPMLRVLKLNRCQNLVCFPLHNLPNLATAVLDGCALLARIDFGDPLCAPSSSSSANSPSSSWARTTTPARNWELRNLWIKGCPRARFVPGEGHLLPSSLTYLYIESDCCCLLDWCKGEGRSWLAKIPSARIWKNIGGKLLVWTVSEVPWGNWEEWDDGT